MSTTKTLLVTLLLLGIVLLLWFGGTFFHENEDSDHSTSEYNLENVEGRFPADLGTTYIGEVDWPPQVEVTEEEYSCVEAGAETARAGQTQKKSLNGHSYCVTTVVEGAAGSVYRQYTYSFLYDDRAAFLRFSLRFPQCANYDSSERGVCEEEQSSFNLDALIDSILTEG